MTASREGGVGRLQVHRATVRAGRPLPRAWAEAAGKGAGVGTDACTDDAFTLFPAGWGEEFAWRFKATTTPKGISRAKATAALKRAAANIARGRNDCDLPVASSADQSYLGRTSRAMNVGKGSTCLEPDGKSVIGFGDLAGDDLGMACWWTVNGQTVEADVKLNKADYRWVVYIGGNCKNRWSVEAVATHEFGHAFGLDHVSEEDHGSLTMSPLIAPCQKSEARLGLGDVLGVEALY